MQTAAKPSSAWGAWRNGPPGGDLARAGAAPDPARRTAGNNCASEGSAPGALPADAGCQQQDPASSSAERQESRVEARGAQQCQSSSKGNPKKKTTGPVHNARYKAKMCKNWMKTQSCPYFEKCQFAHGVAELEKWAARRAKLKQQQQQAPAASTSASQKQPQPAKLKQHQHQQVKSPVPSLEDGADAKPETLLSRGFEGDARSLQSPNSAVTDASDASLLRSMTDEASEEAHNSGADTEVKSEDARDPADEAHAETQAVLSSQNQARDGAARFRALSEISLESHDTQRRLSVPSASSDAFDGYYSFSNPRSQSQQAHLQLHLQQPSQLPHETGTLFPPQTPGTSKSAPLREFDYTSAFSSVLEETKTNDGAGGPGNGAGPGFAPPSGGAAPGRGGAFVDMPPLSDFGGFAPGLPDLSTQFCDLRFDSSPPHTIQLDRSASMSSSSMSSLSSGESLSSASQSAHAAPSPLQTTCTAPGPATSQYSSCDVSFTSTSPETVFRPLPTLFEPEEPDHNPQVPPPQLSHQQCQAASAPSASASTLMYQFTPKPLPPQHAQSAQYLQHQQQQPSATPQASSASLPPPLAGHLQHSHQFQPVQQHQTYPQHHLQQHQQMYAHPLAPVQATPLGVAAEPTYFFDGYPNAFHRPHGSFGTTL